MNIKTFFLAIIILLPSLSFGTDDLEQFYSLSFLRDHVAVRTSLQHYEFKDITFKTPDNLTLKGLFLSRPHATCNVIVCAGWRPGRKEGMATFYNLLPNYCNILFFDARGHGESEGPLLWKLWRYGIDEYKDIIGAISWTNNNNVLPVVVIGACSGAFNAAHALIYLEKNNQLTQCNVKGLVFDSGWGSIIEVTETVAYANAEEIITTLLKRFYTSKDRLSQSIPFQLLANYARCVCKTVHCLFTKQVVKQFEPVTSLFNKINILNTPIFFIHSYDDRHTCIYNAMKLSRLVKQKICWWIKQSYHTRHHLIHKELYKEKLTSFINSVIQ